MTNDKADIILNVVESLNSLKETGEIQYIKYEWDEENNIFNINAIPKQTPKYIDLNFTVTRTGCVFN